MSNEGMRAARVRKDDEFYTRLEDIEAELKNYKAELKGKRIFLNCDGPQSAFLKYFREHYDDFGLAGLLALGRDPETGGWVLSSRTMSRSVPDGDFRGEFSRDLMKRESDVVITNPPFSLFRSWFDTVMSAQKEFIVLCNQNAVTCKNVFPYIKENKVGVGYGHMSCTMEFYRPSHDVKRISSLTWLTTFHTPGKKLTLTESYYADPANYPKYDNYDAINVNKVKEIPYDYDGVMGVPITFLQYMNGGFTIIANVAPRVNGKQIYRRLLLKNNNPDEFEIVWQASGNTRQCAPKEVLTLLNYSAMKADRGGCGVIHGKRVYSRIIIRKNVSNK